MVLCYKSTQRSAISPKQCELVDQLFIFKIQHTAEFSTILKADLYWSERALFSSNLFFPSNLESWSQIFKSDWRANFWRWQLVWLFKQQHVFSMTPMCNIFSSTFLFQTQSNRFFWWGSNRGLANRDKRRIEGLLKVRQEQKDKTLRK